MRLTRQLLGPIARLAWLLAGIAAVWLSLAVFCLFGCAVFLVFACVEGAIWLFMLPGRILALLTQLRLPRGLK